ncbi:hypothetical protein T484DRAFT_1884118, partial [Baffinella frigidus]
MAAGSMGSRRRRELLVVLVLSALSAPGSQLSAAPSGHGSQRPQETPWEPGSTIRAAHRTCLLLPGKGIWGGAGCRVRCLRGGGGILAQLPQLRGGWDEEEPGMSTEEELFGLRNSSSSDSSSDGGLGPVTAAQMREWELELFRGDPATVEELVSEDSSLDGEGITRRRCMRWSTVEELVSDDSSLDEEEYGEFSRLLAKHPDKSRRSAKSNATANTTSDALPVTSVGGGATGKIG